MKRLVSVIILAGAPIACGTQSPSAPETVAPSSETADALASASSVARITPTRACLPGDRSHVRAIALREVSRGLGFVTLRAEVASVAGDADPVSAAAVCLEPSFAVTPLARLDRSTPEQVTVFGASGRYTVTATSVVSQTTRPLVATKGIKVE